MFGFKKNRTTHPDETPRPGLFQRLKQRLGRTRGSLTDGFAPLVLGRIVFDDEILDEIETRLLTADVGAEATSRIIADLTARVKRNQLADADALLAALKEDMHAILAPCDAPPLIPPAQRPFAILMVGVNGGGKTTTIGKLAKRLQGDGLSVMLAAGDTFRAAAVEQLQPWGERNDVAVIAQARSADPASVIFDGLQAAKARGIDVLIADTAGRLHTQTNLMEELKKVKRVLTKLDPSAPHETLLVIDAGTGQNALNQARQFLVVVGLTGLILTKLDGTAKGGIIFVFVVLMKLPISFIGVGEGIDDLRPFDAGVFVEALFASEAEA